MLSLDLKEFIQSLNENAVRYLLIGGYALALHGHPRYTKDLDVWIEPTDNNASAMINALKSFGFASLGLQSSDFTELDQVIQLGYPPNRIDILTSADGLEFAEAFERRLILSLDGIQLSYVCLDDLITNKKATGRLQDLADIEKLQGP